MTKSQNKWIVFVFLSLLCPTFIYGGLFISISPLLGLIVLLFLWGKYLVIPLFVFYILMYATVLYYLSNKITEIIFKNTIFKNSFMLSFIGFLFGLSFFKIYFFYYWESMDGPFNAFKYYAWAIYGFMK